MGALFRCTLSERCANPSAVSWGLQEATLLALLVRVWSGRGLHGRVGVACMVEWAWPAEKTCMHPLYAGVLNGLLQSTHNMHQLINEEEFKQKEQDLIRTLKKVSISTLGLDLCQFFLQSLPPHNTGCIEHRRELAKEWSGMPEVAVDPVATVSRGPTEGRHCRGLL